MAAAANRAFILMNLGSPDSTSVRDVHAYLTEFLMDKRVIDYPYLFRKLLVGGLIVPFRARKSAEAYHAIWTKEGSPLIVLSRQLQQALQAKISVPVELAMRYGKPSMEKAFEALANNNKELEEVIALPLYPHYAMASYETAVEHAKKIHRKKNYDFRLSFVPPFYNQPAYIRALCESIRPFLQQEYDHLLFSYHGVPGRHIKKTDPTGTHCLCSQNCCDTVSPAHAVCYRHQVFTTTRLVAAQLKLPANKYSISFQSRLGKGWLEPFTDIRLMEMPKEGVKKLLVICPAFVSDCLETLEEIEIRGKEIFLDSGGSDFAMIPCLNSGPLWVDAVLELLNQ